jgi:hypothetical protein
MSSVATEDGEKFAWLLVLLVIKKFKISLGAMQMFQVNVICQYVYALRSANKLFS